MISKIFKKIKYYNVINSDLNSSSDKRNRENSKMDPVDEIPDKIENLINKLKCCFNNSSDFIMREIIIGKEKKQKLLVAFIDGLTNMQLINADILRPLMIETKTFEIYGQNVVDLLKNQWLSSCEVKEILDLKQALDAILSGDTVIFADNEKRAIKVSLRGWDKRNIEEPTTDPVIRGPKEGFTETLRTNTALLRRKIKNTNLKFETVKVGEQTNTDVCICYIKGIANDEVINEVRDRISRIKTDAILESGYIEEFIQDSPLSIFPTVGNSEKPDIIAGKVLEGRVAVLCDGTPFVLTVPYLFVESIQSSEDYYSRAVYSILNRFIRALALFITTMLPAYYVALVNFHQDIIPYKLLLTMTASREGIPFPAIIEALIMVITFELLREAGVRMPRAIGQAVSIVGALVIGDAAVKAGLVSTPMVIVIALTAITSFIISSLADALLIIRIVTIFAANTIGILGIVLASSAFFISMCNKKSFGVNYLSPFTPLSGMDLKDTFVRFPLWAMLTRPKTLTWEHGGNSRFRNKPLKKGK